MNNIVLDNKSLNQINNTIITEVMAAEITEINDFKKKYINTLFFI